MTKKKSPSSETHEQKATLSVDVFLPGHDPRTTTTLFRRTKQKLMALASLLVFKPWRAKGRCFICNQTGDEVGQPLEAHHFGVERAFVDAPLRWDLIKMDFPNFNWADFDPTHPESFVDDMLAQGVLLCKAHHTGKDTGIHTLPFNLWLMQKYLPEGTKFTPDEVIHHDQW